MSLSRHHTLTRMTNTVQWQLLFLFSFRLQVLVLCGPEQEHLEHFAEKFLRKGRGALILGHVIVQDLDDYENNDIEAAYEVWLARLV